MEINSILAKYSDYLRFGAEQESTKAPQTIERYGYCIERYLFFLNGQEPAADNALAFMKSLLETGNKPKSVNLYLRALKSYFRMNGQELKARGLKVDKSIPRYLKEQEWMKLLVSVTEPFRNKERPEYARESAKKNLAILMLYCGGALRLSEGVAIKIADIDWGGSVKVLGKGGKPRIVSLEASVTEAIKQYLQTRNDDNPYLFPGRRRDSHLSTERLAARIKEMSLKAGLSGVHTHTLRHTAATTLLLSGASLLEIRDFLGHENIETTQIYTHMTREELDKRLPSRIPAGGIGLVSAGERTV